MASRTIRRRTATRTFNKKIGGKPRPFLRFLVLFLVGFTMLTSGASAATMFFYGNSLPTLKNFKARFQFQNTLIRDSSGEVLYDMSDNNKGRRVVEPLQWPLHNASWYKQHHQYWLVGPNDHGIPRLLQNATIATEDSTFYSNPGFDPVSIVRAGYDNFTRGHVVSGASTITQQLVKQYMLSPDPTLSRKTEEIILSLELTQKYDKSQILWYYLNSISYGNLSIGAEAAAETYFNTYVWKLDLAQCAFLAGLPEAPTTYNPVNNLPAALNRMRYVLHLMYIHGYLVDSRGKPDPTLIDQAMAEPIKYHWRFKPVTAHMKFPHFVQYAVDQLEHIPQLQGKVYNGLDVWTTLDPRLQSMAQNTVQKQVSQLGGYNVSDGALVSLDIRKPYYGWIRAMVGSADYNNTQISGQINMADSPRQPGSSFKPLNYIVAFENGLSPGSSVDDQPIAIPDPGNPEDGGMYEPQNYDHQFHGEVTLRTALANSLNIPAIKVEEFSGVDKVAAEAMKLGITSLRSDNPHCCGWSLTLGGLERGVRLVQETAAFGSFASGGVTVPPVAIARVYDRTTHKLLYNSAADAPVKPSRVIPAPYAYLMNNVLSDNASRCTPQVCEFGLDSPLALDRPAAAKTGTTNGYTDNWTVGYTPQIVTGVWVGNADNSPMVNTTGVTGAAPIWHDYMENAFRILNLPPEDFIQPAGVYAGSECRVSSAGYTSYNVMAYDIYASVVPLCSADGGTTAAVPAQPAPYQPPAVSQPAPQIQSTQIPPTQAPTQPPAALAPTSAPAPVLQPTSPPLPPAQQQPAAPIATAPAAPVAPPVGQPTP